MSEVKPTYAMFTKEGDERVHEIVKEVRNADPQMSWEDVMELLTDLECEEEYGEATDTAVREIVFEAVEGYILQDAMRTNNCKCQNTENTGHNCFKDWVQSILETQTRKYLQSMERRYSSERSE